jgi:hypothetical protein
VKSSSRETVRNKVTHYDDQPLVIFNFGQNPGNTQYAKLRVRPGTGQVYYDLLGSLRGPMTEKQLSELKSNGNGFEVEFRELTDEFNLI